MVSLNNVLGNKYRLLIQSPPWGHVFKRGECSILKHVFVLGLAVVGIMLRSPCRALLVNLNADVIFHPTDSATTEAILNGQIQAAKALVVGAYADGYNSIDLGPGAYYTDSHTKVFAYLQAGASGIIALDRFDSTRTMPNTNDPVGLHRRCYGIACFGLLGIRTGSCAGTPTNLPETA